MKVSQMLPNCRKMLSNFFFNRRDAEGGRKRRMKVSQTKIIDIQPNCIKTQKSYYTHLDSTYTKRKGEKQKAF